MRRRIGIVLVAIAVVLPAFGQTKGPRAEERLVYRPVLLFNEHLYGGTMAAPRSLAYDKKRKEIWVADGGAGLVSVHRPDGAELFSFVAGRITGEPARIAVTPDGDVAVVGGPRRKIRMFSYRGEHKGPLELEKLADSPVFSALTWDASGNLYVAEKESAQILVYSPSGSLKFQFGSRGTDEGQFIQVTGIAVDTEGRIYVADARAIAVQVFDAQGNFLRGWGEHAMGAQNFSLPSGIAVDSKFRVIVADELRHTFKVFSNEGRLLANVGGFGSGFGEIAYPADVAVDENDRVIVAERVNARVQIFELVPSGN